MRLNSTGSTGKLGKSVELYAVVTIFALFSILRSTIYRNLFLKIQSYIRFKVVVESFRHLIIAFFLLNLTTSVVAQPSPPPAGISKEQFDALVDAIGDAVVAKLKATPPADSTAQAPPVAANAVQQGVDARIGEFVERAGAAILAFPELGRRLAGLPALIVDAGGGRGLWAFMALLFGAMVAALGAERFVGWLFGRLQTRLAAQAGRNPGMPAASPLLGLFAIDALKLAAVWLVSHGAIGIWFSRASGQDKLAAAILAGLFAWRLYMLAFRVLLRPTLPGARLASMDDSGARAVYRLISLVIMLIVSLRIMIRLLIATNAPPEVVAAAQILVSTTTTLLAAWAAIALRVPMSRWFADLPQNQEERSLGRRIGVHWLYVALPLFVILGLTQIYGAIAMRYTVPNATLLTLNALIGLILLQTLSRYVTRPRDVTPLLIEGEPVPAEGAAAPPRTPVRHRFIDVVARCVRVAILIGVVVMVAQSWIVDVLALVDGQGWRALARASFATGVTLFLAFVAWQLVDFFTRPGTAGAAGPESAASGLHDGGGGAGSRLATLLPLLRFVLAITISVLALLLVLSELGVNITPLLAGASVFGLAVSFGSQALVRDIVSGVFYLSDDAFRIGEYIDCGKAKGSVEGFTLRSIRLRHQNGQVHTIPFGQLGQITNFSRDWATVKFNLRFKRDTDLEKLRKTVKKLGDAMAEDPEFKAEFIAPLRMQGVADILDNAILVRFKLTVRPTQPSYVQRVAVKLMVAKFAEVGIEFADSMVAVQTLAAGGDPAAAAAVSLAQNRSRAEMALATEGGAQ